MGFLSVLWALIKIILSVIGILLLIFLILLGIILFSAIRYKIFFNKDREDISADLKVNWIFKIIKFEYIFGTKGKETIVKIFNKVVYETGEEFETEEEFNEEIEDGIDEVEKVEKKVEKRVKKVVKDEKAENKIEKIPESKSKQSSQETKNSDKIKKEEKETFSEDVKEETETENLEKQEENIIKRALNLWNHEFRKPIQTLIIKLIKRLIRALKPKSLNMDIEYGSDDPADTGIALAWTSILTLYFGDNVRVKGNFQEKVFNGIVNTEGKFTLWGILYPLAAFALSKPIRGIIWNYLKNRKKED